VPEAKPPPTIWLASKSPRRGELLAQIGVAFDVLRLREGAGRTPDVPEVAHDAEPALHYVERIARTKANVGWQSMVARRLTERPVLGADTEVILDGEVFGKPADERAAKAMLARLAGRTHEVVTAVALRWRDDTHFAMSTSKVTLAPLSKAAIAAYVASGEPFGVCRIVKGDEVAGAAASQPQFSPIGTLARIVDWDMPDGVLHLRAEGGDRFQVRSHSTQDDGLVVGSVIAIAREPARSLPDAYRPLAQLLEVLVQKIGDAPFASTRAFDDSSWVGYRLAAAWECGARGCTTQTGPGTLSEHNMRRAGFRLVYQRRDFILRSMGDESG
jgi:septum formation protein